MAVGIFLLTHDGIAGALVTAAKSVVGAIPLRVGTFDFRNGEDVDLAFRRAGNVLRDLDDGAGVLVMTDLYGATPSNLAAKLLSQGTAMRRVSGLNLPMLLRVLNYAELPLEELVLVAASGARNGVVIDSL